MIIYFSIPIFPSFCEVGRDWFYHLHPWNTTTVQLVISFDVSELILAPRQHPEQLVGVIVALLLEEFFHLDGSIAICTQALVMQ